MVLGVCTYLTIFATARFITRKMVLRQATFGPAPNLARMSVCFSPRERSSAATLRLAPWLVFSSFSFLAQLGNSINPSTPKSHSRCEVEQPPTITLPLSGKAKPCNSFSFFFFGLKEKKNHHPNWILCHRACASLKTHIYCDLENKRSYITWIRHIHLQLQSRLRPAPSQLPSIVPYSDTPHDLSKPARLTIETRCRILRTCPDRRI